MSEIRPGGQMTPRKSAQQQEWERLRKSQPQLPPTPTYTEPILLSRRQFNHIWQLAYRRGMERSAGVAGVASNPGIIAANRRGEVSGDKLIGYRMGVDDAAARIRRFIEQGAKDE